MILVDTAIWVDHLGKGHQVMATLLDADRVVTHPFVVGEIALGSLRDRDATLAVLNAMPMARLAKHEEVMALIERYGLAGAGIGYVDAHLIASTFLSPGTALWSRDKRLQAAAERLGIAAHPVH